MALPIRQAIFDEAQKITTTQIQTYRLNSMPGFANGGYVSGDGPAFYGSPGYNYGRPIYVPEEYLSGTMTVTLKNDGGREVTVDVDRRDSTVKIDLNAYLVLMKELGYK